MAGDEEGLPLVCQVVSRGRPRVLDLVRNAAEVREMEGWAHSMMEQMAIERDGLRHSQHSRSPPRDRKSTKQAFVTGWMCLPRVVSF